MVDGNEGFLPEDELDKLAKHLHYARKNIEEEKKELLKNNYSQQRELSNEDFVR